MAVSAATMQSIFAGPASGFGYCKSSSSRVQGLPSMYMQRRQSNGSLRMRCMAGKEQEEETPTPKVSTRFSDILAFSGPAPERINGRLAMIGFVSAIGVELVRGDDVISQIANGGLPWFVGTTVILSLASLIPLFKGTSVQSKSDGVMTSDAELWNGRFAMLGLVALVMTEFVKGGALV